MCCVRVRVRVLCCVVFYYDFVSCIVTFIRLDNGVIMVMIRVMVFNATFNNIPVISWWSVLLMEETGVHGETHRPVESH